MPTSKQERERRFEEKFLDCRAEKLVRNRPYFWKQVWDGGDQMVDNSDPDKIKAFLEEEIAKAVADYAQEERQFILNILNGVDIADEQMGNKGGGTKAIRFALQSRALPSLSTKEPR